MKKRILTMVLAMMVTCLSVVGCGSTKETSKSDTKETTKETTEADEEEQELELTRGTIADGVYTNETFGVSFPIADNMMTCTDEQIVQMLNLGQEVITSEGVYDEEQMEEALNGSMYDAVIILSDNQSNVMVMYEDMNQTNAISYTAEQYAKILADQLETVESMQYQSEGTSTEKIDGTDFVVLKMSMGESGMQQKYYLKKVSNCMIGFIISYTEETEQEVTDFMSNVTFKNPLEK